MESGVADGHRSAQAAACTQPYMLTLDCRLLLIEQATELAGIDNMEHGGPAYPEFTQAGEQNCPA